MMIRLLILLKTIWLFFVITLIGFIGWHQPLNAMDHDKDMLDRCLLEKLKEASDNTTVGELKKECLLEIESQKILETKEQEKTDVPKKSPLKERIRKEQKTAFNPFVITPYRPNYILLAAYSPDTDTDPVQEDSSDTDVSLDNLETKFQLSLKVPVLTNIIADKGSLFVAYTQRSFWQSYNTDFSSPFRETNFEPEIFFSFWTGWSFFNWKSIMIDFGVNHQSNGLGGTLSRSWNRIFSSFVFEHQKHNFYIGIKPWIVVGDDEDNPDITDYLGHGELLFVYKLDYHTFSLMLRNNFQKDPNRWGIQLDWSFPIYQRLRGYLQYFNGYGESLLDYNQNRNSFGAGLQITDWM